MNVLVTNNLSKKYKDTYAVKDANMHIEKGDIYGFVGENGAGKTTIIRLISGLANPTSGSYSLFDIDSKSKDIYSSKRKVAAIVEKVSLNSAFTALENMRYQNTLVNANKTDEQLIELINSCGLNYSYISKRKVKNFSLGMRQRLGIAMIMVQDPEFVILDEPMNGLDPQGFVQIREAIVNLHNKGVTFLISSHILSELDKICTKIGFISHGKLVKELSMDELHNKASKKIVIGSDNLNELKEYLVSSLKLEKIEEENNKLIIYDDVSISDFVKELAKSPVEYNSINTVEESIEDYYISLIQGGSKNA